MRFVLETLCIFSIDNLPYSNNRSFPSNMKYLHCNILKPLDFDREIFDVIHMRSLLYHVGVYSCFEVIQGVQHLPLVT